MARKNPALHRALNTEVLGVDLMSRCRWLGRVITPKVMCIYIYLYVRVYYITLHYITLLYQFCFLFNIKYYIILYYIYLY